MIAQRGRPTSVLEAMLIGCLLFLQTWGCSRCENGINGYSSKVKDFKDLGIKIKMILDNKNWIKFVTRSRDIILKDLQHLLYRETLKHYETLLAV
jgi:hypothetical protein